MIFNAKRSKFNSIVSVLDKSPLKSELKTVRIAPKNGFTSKYHARFSPMNVGCLVKTPSPFNCFFHALSCFCSSYRLSKCWLHTLTKGFT